MHALFMWAVVGPFGCLKKRAKTLLARRRVFHLPDLAGRRGEGTDVLTGAALSQDVARSVFVAGTEFVASAALLKRRRKKQK